MDTKYAGDKFVVQLAHISVLVDSAATAPINQYKRISTSIMALFELDKKHIRNMVMHDIYYANVIQFQLEQTSAKLKKLPKKISKHGLLIDAFTEVILFGGEIVQTCIVPLGVLMMQAHRAEENKHQCPRSSPSHTCSSSCRN
jgi:hypothetical protein